MQIPPEPYSDRRHSFRADVNGCAIVHAPGGPLRCIVVDLCLGGVRLLELVRGAPDLAPGVELTLELEVAGAGWCAQRARVLRHEQGELALAFARLTPEIEDLIEDEVLSAVEARRAPRVVVVDCHEPRRRRVAEVLRSSGCCSLEATTPLKAIDLVEQSRTHVAAVCVAETLTQTQADELIGFLAESHPRVRIALIADAHGPRHHQPRWQLAVVITCDGDEVHVGPVHSLAALLPCESTETTLG